MKKKILSLALVVALVAIMVGGSLAYFTDNDQVTNTFTIGSVKIEIYENNQATDKDSFEFGMLTPIVNEEEPSQDVSYIPKVVNVKNIGNNSAYIRTHIAIPADLKNYLHLDLNATGWTQQTNSEATVDGVKYVVYTYDHDAAVAPTMPTEVLLKGVYLGSDVDLEEDANGSLWFVRKTNGVITDRSGYMAHQMNTDGTYTCKGVNVLVASQAIQADGFDDATEALNSGFSSNPWA